MIYPKQICSYIMTHDSGLAPNPFHNFCTLAVCTPNHMRANLQKGDWICGVAGAQIRKRLSKSNDEWRLIYAMKIEQVLSMDEYYNDSNYKNKIPKLQGSAMRQCGDNFYRKMSDGELSHTRETTDHQGVGIEAQDTEGDRVFIGNDFWYFGKEAPEIPNEEKWGEKLLAKFSNCSVGLRYMTCSDIENEYLWSEVDFRSFVNWLPRENGLLGEPVHFSSWTSNSECKSTCGA